MHLYTGWCRNCIKYSIGDISSVKFGQSFESIRHRWCINKTRTDVLKKVMKFLINNFFSFPLHLNNLKTKEISHFCFKKKRSIDINSEKWENIKKQFKIKPIYCRSKAEDKEEIQKVIFSEMNCYLHQKQNTRYKKLDVFFFNS